MYAVGFRGFCKLFALDEREYIGVFYDFIIYLNKNVAIKFFKMLRTHNYIDDETFKNKKDQLKLIEHLTKKKFSIFISYNRCFLIMCQQVFEKIEIQNKTFESKIKQELEFCKRFWN